MNFKVFVKYVFGIYNIHTIYITVRVCLRIERGLQSSAWSRYEPSTAGTGVKSIVDKAGIWGTSRYRYTMFEAFGTDDIFMDRSPHSQQIRSQSISVLTLVVLDFFQEQHQTMVIYSWNN